MKHTMGNATHCVNCYHYRPKEDNDGCPDDGWCLNGLYVGKKKVADVTSVDWNDGSGCYDWEDAEDRITHYEAMTGKVDPFRHGIDKLYYELLLEGEKNDD